MKILKITTTNGISPQVLNSTIVEKIEVLIIDLTCPL